MKQNFKKKKGFFALMFISIFFVLSGVVMFLWNSILPDLLNVNIITYWQSMGLLVLSRILFGRFGKPNRPGYYKGKFNEKFMNMTQQEKEEFRDKWKKRCDNH